jgi:hypothetical protein
LRLKLLLQSWEGINRRVIVKFWQKWLKRAAKYCGLRPRNSVIKKELPDWWNESITVTVHKKSDKTDCSNYCGISLVSNSYTILSNILSRLNHYVDEINGDNQCGFWRDRPITDRTFCICQILKTKWEYNGTVHQLFVDLKKAYNSGRREVVYNILTEFGLLMKLVRLIKMCLKKSIVKSI